MPKTKCSWGGGECAPGMQLPRRPLVDVGLGGRVLWLPTWAPCKLSLSPPFFLFSRPFVSYRGDWLCGGKGEMPGRWQELKHPVHPPGSPVH